MAMTIMGASVDPASFKLLIADTGVLDALPKRFSTKLA